MKSRYITERFILVVALTSFLTSTFSGIIEQTKLGFTKFSFS